MNIFEYQELPEGKTAGDSYAVWEEDGLLALAVADAPLRYLTENRGDLQANYHGKEASQLFCDAFIEFIKGNYDKPELRPELARSAVLYANERIREFNISQGFSYPPGAEYDLPECVGFAAVVIDGILYYAGLEDCYINLLYREEKKGVVIFTDRIKLAYTLARSFKWSNEIIERALSDPAFLQKYLSPELIEQFKDINLLEALRNIYQRNNTEAISNDGRQMVGWGCFNGEPEVESFIQSGSVEIEPGDRLLLVTDGILPFLNSDEILEMIDSLINSGVKLNSQEVQESIKLYIQKVIEANKAAGIDIDKERTMLLAIPIPN